MVLWLLLAALLRLIGLDTVKRRGRVCTCKRFPCACRTNVAGRSHR
jgi:hypothetical protein